MKTFTRDHYWQVSDDGLILDSGYANTCKDAIECAEVRMKEIQKEIERLRKYEKERCK